MDLFFSASLRRTKQVGKINLTVCIEISFKMETAELTSQAIGTCVHPFVCQQ